MSLEAMKRRTPNLMDYIKQPLSTSRIPYSSTNNISFPQKSDKKKTIQNICIIVMLIFIVTFIHIISQLKTPQIITIHNDINDSDQHNIDHILSRTDALLFDDKQELMNTEDIIIKHEELNPKQTTSIETALSFTNDDCANKHECGRCWLHRNINIVIEISSIIPIPIDRLDASYKNLHLFAYWITFRSVQQTICSAKDITIYVSIVDKNSESVGGLAIVDNTSLCGWKYKWIVSKSGQYTINGYLLYYRGYLDFNQNKCGNVKNIQYIDTSDDGSYTLNKLPLKWRFYGHIEGCCEWCNRMNGVCKSWSSGGKGSDKCILYTESPMDEDSHIIVEKHNGFISGIYRNEPQQWYLGSLLNIQPNECHNSKLDLIYGSEWIYDVPQRLFINHSYEGVDKNNLCITNHEMGRWISINDMECSAEFNSWCWIRKHFNKVPFRWKPYQCSYKQNKIQHIEQCLIENNMHRIAVGGDSLIRLFSLELVRYIFGDPLMKGNNVENWAYSKHYIDKNIQLWFMGYDHNIDDISFMKEFIVEPNNVNKPNVFIHNFQVIHKIWHLNTTQFGEIMRHYKDTANELFTKYYGVQSDGKWPIRMVFEAPLLVSEREYHDTADRAIIYNKIMRDILEPDGWVFIPVFEISKARMYDSTNVKDGVVDGMHMSGNILIEIARVAVDILCRFDLKHHTTNTLNELYMSV